MVFLTGEGAFLLIPRGAVWVVNILNRGFSSSLRANSLSTPEEPSPLGMGIGEVSESEVVFETGAMMLPACGGAPCASSKSCTVSVCARVASLGFGAESSEFCGRAGVSASPENLVGL